MKKQGKWKTNQKCLLECLVIDQLSLNTIIL